MLVVFPYPFVPNADGCKASTSLGWGPLKLGWLKAHGSQAVPLFEPHDSFTNSYS